MVKIFQDKNNIYVNGKCISESKLKYGIRMGLIKDDYMKRKDIYNDKYDKCYIPKKNDKVSCDKCNNKEVCCCRFKITCPKSNPCSYDCDNDKYEECFEDTNS